MGGGTLTLTTGKAGATNLTLNSGTYVAIIYVDENGNVTTQGTTVVNSVTVGNMQSVSSSAVANALSNKADNLYVECSFNGTAITVTNNLHRTDLAIEGITMNGGSTFSYFFRTTLSETENPQSITSYGGRQLQDYDTCFINIWKNNDCIASGLIANIVSNTMGLRILC